MAKESGLNARLYVGGYNLSGDVGAMNVISGRKAQQDVTGLDKEAMERVDMLADGEMSFNAFFNSDPIGLLALHQALSTLPTADRIASYFHRATLGVPAANIIGKQINYDWNRAQTGELLGTIQILSNGGKGIEWGIALTPGSRVDSGPQATPPGFDTGVASTAFGWSAYLHVMALTGTNIIVTLQDSADGSSWANLADGAFASVLTAGVPAQQRIAGAITSTVRRHLRAVTSGTFSSGTIAVAFVRNEAAQVGL